MGVHTLDKDKMLGKVREEADFIAHNFNPYFLTTAILQKLQSNPSHLFVK